MPCPVLRPRSLHAIHCARGTRYLTCYLSIRHLAKDSKYPGRLPQPCLFPRAHSLHARQPDPFVSPCTDQRWCCLLEYHHDQPSSLACLYVVKSARACLSTRSMTLLHRPSESHETPRAAGPAHHVVSMPSNTGRACLHLHIHLHLRLTFTLTCVDACLFLCTPDRLTLSSLTT